MWSILGPIQWASGPLDLKQDGRSWKAQPNDPDIIIMIICILYKNTNDKKSF